MLRCRRHGSTVRPQHTLAGVADQLSIPRLVAGVLVEDLSEDGHAGSVDTEVGFELPEIAAVVDVVAMGDLEGIVVGLGLVDASKGEGRGVSVNDITRDGFGIGRSERHDPEVRARLFVRDVEAACTRVIGESPGSTSWTNRFSTSVPSKFGQPMCWLPFGENVHEQRSTAYPKLLPSTRAENAIYELT